MIQQSYYAGKPINRKAEGQHPTWNPIQGGGVGEVGGKGNWARVTVFERQDAGSVPTLDSVPTLHSVTIPKLWNMRDEDAAATMEQWTRHEPAMPEVVAVRCRFEPKRDTDDRWGTAAIRSQETPACDFTRNFARFESYLGDSKWRGETQPPGPPWGTFQATEGGDGAVRSYWRRH